MQFFKSTDEGLTQHLINLSKEISEKCIKLKEHAYRNMPHLLLDLSADTSIINQRTLLDVLSELPVKIGMHLVSEPLVVEGDAICMLRESHIAIHRLDEDYIAVDIFSCKSFDVAVAVNYLIKKLKVNYLGIELIYRACNLKDK